MNKTTKVIVFKVEATIEISGSDPYCFSEITEILENLRGFGTAEVVDVEIKKQEASDETEGMGTDIST